MPLVLAVAELMTAIHVVVDHVPETSEPFYARETFWVAVGSIVSTAVAVGTLVLAYFTRDLARETHASVIGAQREIAAEERRYRQGFAPHLAIRVTPVEDPFGNVARYAIELRNIGPGYARGIDLAFSESATGPALRRSIVVPSAIAAGESVIAAEFLPDEHYDAGLQVSYRDAFDQRFSSRTTAPIGPHLTYEYREEQLGGP